MYVNDIVGDVNSQHLDPDAVLLREMCIRDRPHRLPNGKAQYYYTTLKDQELFSIAGLWDEWTHPQTGERCV